MGFAGGEGEEEEMSDAETEVGDDSGLPVLRFGSADPHGVGGVDRAPWARRAAPFSVHAHMAADGEELEVRPTPEANVAPTTAARPPPSPVAGYPPVVVRVEQVVPLASQRLVVWWRRRL